MHKRVNLLLIPTLLYLLTLSQVNSVCQPCYNQKLDQNCQAPPQNQPNISSHTLHMSVHPHLDAFWIFDFQSYYSPKANQSMVWSYFASNRFSSVKQIFNTITTVLSQSKKLREKDKVQSQNAHRSFFNSEIGFFKRWYLQQNQPIKKQVKQLLKTKYWEIVNGGYVEHDQGCAYYDDIIENFQTGLRFMKDEFGYYPRIAISADSFGHSQSTLAILTHLGIEGFFVQRSDQHILLTNKTQFIWKAKSANGNYYGAIPTHIRWAIHGFQDQFVPGTNQKQILCETKQNFIQNMRRQNQFLKTITRSNHIMRYFGHDFQEFNEYSYRVIEEIMRSFSTEKCNKVTALYGNPTQYFKIMMGEVFNKTKPLQFRQQDIMPIWDYDSGLYWTGYYTTDPFHKKGYRDAGRYLAAARKIFAPFYIVYPNSSLHNNSYKLLQEFAETVSYLQHHDGVSGTSKYDVMDRYENLTNHQIKQIKQTIFQQMFELQFPNNVNNPVFDCSLESECFLPEHVVTNDIYLKIFKTGGSRKYQPIIIHLPENQYFQPNCQYQLNCFCFAMPCSCDLYLYPQLSTYTLLKLKKKSTFPKSPNFLHQIIQNQDNKFQYNQTHVTITHNSKLYSIGYKKLNGDPTQRFYAHLSRYGDQISRGFSIRSGKYALGSNIHTQQNLSKIRKVLKLQDQVLTKYIILWKREQMKTIITIPKNKKNQWKVQTLSSAQSGKLQDLYLEISAPHINNNQTFYTDSNGWLVMKRQLFKHEDYQAYFPPEKYDDINGNSYPMTSFAYIQDIMEKNNKMSVNTDRTQGVIAYKPGTIWVNYDRLTSDDGKWVDETTHRTQYQKYVHYITVDNNQNNERTLQKLYDEPLIIQGSSVSQNQRVFQEVDKINQARLSWQNKTGINKVKFHIRPFNDSTLMLRVQNNKDYQNVTIQLFSWVDNISTFLTAFYGSTIKFNKVQQYNLGGNIQYKQFLQRKWNWKNIVDLSQQNQIFNKELSQTITLRPLQIRTFIFKDITIDTQICIKLQNIKYSNKKIVYTLDLNKAMPIRSDQQKQNEKKIIDYLLNQNHCNIRSPVQEKKQEPITNIRVQSQKPITIDENKIVPQQTKENVDLVSQPPNQQQNINNNIETPQKIVNVPIVNNTNKVLKPPIQQQPVQPPPPISDNKTGQFNFSKVQLRVIQLKPLTKQQKIKYFQNVFERVKNKLTVTSRDIPIPNISVSEKEKN